MDINFYEDTPINELISDDETEVRCKKCGVYHPFKELTKYYCKKCVDTYPKRCDECQEPISNAENARGLGYCRKCHRAWLKTESNKIVKNVETYPGTGF